MINVHGGIYGSSTYKVIYLPNPDTLNVWIFLTRLSSDVPYNKDNSWNDSKEVFLITFFFKLQTIKLNRLGDNHFLWIKMSRHMYAIIILIKHLNCITNLHKNINIYLCRTEDFHPFHRTAQVFSKNVVGLLYCVSIIWNRLQNFHKNLERVYKIVKWSMPSKKNPPDWR